MKKRYAIEVYHYPEKWDEPVACSDDADGAEFELVVFHNEGDRIGELVNVYSSRAQAEAIQSSLETEAA